MFTNTTLRMRVRRTRGVGKTRFAAVLRRQILSWRPGIHSVPARGTWAMAAASTVRATRSFGSRLCTSDFPQARASAGLHGHRLEVVGDLTRAAVRVEPGLQSG